MTDADLPEDPDATGDVLHVPDDISSLAADVLALRREEHARRRRQRWEHATRWARRMRWHDVSIPVIVAVLLVVAGLGTMLVLLGPHSTAPIDGADGIPGRPGGPILAVDLLESDGSRVATTSLSGPAAVLLVPVSCGCDATVAAVSAAASHAALESYVVVDARAATGDEYADSDGLLLAQYGQLGTTPTLLHIDERGVVLSVRVGLTADTAVAAVDAG
jgi:hypothetical protein